MKLISFLIPWVIFQHMAWSTDLPTIEGSPFQKGDEWVWAYSEWDSKNLKWSEPYLYEKYRVTEVQGHKVEIEMSSDSQLNHQSPAHHKFVADTEACLRKGKSSKDLKSWRIAFYTKSFGSQWKLVSKQHKGLAFTEKFNCLKGAEEILSGEVTYENRNWTIFNPNPNQEGSWYFYDHPHLRGVTAMKDFGGYKMVLIKASRSLSFSMGFVRCKSQPASIDL